MFDKVKQRIADRDAAIEARADWVHVSTLSIAPRPFEQVEVLTAERMPTPPEAWAKLRELAAGRGCDAVLGAALVSWDNGGFPRFVAYGTGVRWTAEDAG